VPTPRVSPQWPSRVIAPSWSQRHLTISSGDSLTMILLLSPSAVCGSADAVWDPRGNGSGNNLMHAILSLRFLEFTA